MLTAVLTATGVVVGVPAWLLGGMLLAFQRPIWVLLALAAAIALSRAVPGDPPVVAEADFLGAVADELRAGASLPSALADAARAAPALSLGPLPRLALAGRPSVELASVLKKGLPVLGAAAAATMEMVRELGGGGAATFEALSLVAQDEAHAARAYRVATAQARMSALLVGGLPVVFLAFLVVSGRFADLFRQAPHLLMVGTLLLLAGAAAIGLLLRRARP